ncbi:MAG: response regulator [Ferruginibacter sp.]
MNPYSLNLLLADDDRDDCIFFKEALEEIPITTKLITVNDGVELMELLLKEDTVLPYVLFLDLNMPRKNGLDSLAEIKLHEKLKALPVIMFSTSCNAQTADKLQQHGARFYIQKPPEFEELKKIIHKSLTLIMKNSGKSNKEEAFLLIP